jgi:hypothetical protein
MILGEMIQGHHRTHYFDEKLVSLVPALVNYLKRPSKSQQFTRKDFKICRSAAQLITTICANDLNQMMNVLGYLKVNKN